MHSLLNFLLEREDQKIATEFLELRLRPQKVAEGSQFRSVGVYSFGRGMFQRGLIEASETKYSTLFEVREGDLVLSRLKAFEGAVAVADQSVSGGFVSQEFPTFRIDPNVCSYRYLHYLCRWPSFWSRLAQVSKGVGSRRERLSVQTLLTTELPLPSLARQEQIVSLLDQGIERLGRLVEKRRRLMEALRPALLNAAFSGQL